MPEDAGAPASKSPSASTQTSLRTEGSEGIQSSKRSRALAGMICALSELNGRFIKTPASSKCAGTSLAITGSETPANEAYTQ